jgi:hypothetical protein
MLSSGEVLVTKRFSTDSFCNLIVTEIYTIVIVDTILIRDGFILRIVYRD